jgi:hypothetical protein
LCCDWLFHHYHRHHHHHHPHHCYCYHYYYYNSTTTMLPLPLLLLLLLLLTIIDQGLNHLQFHTKFNISSLKKHCVLFCYTVDVLQSVYHPIYACYDTPLMTYQLHVSGKRYHLQGVIT